MVKTWIALILAGALLSGCIPTTQSQPSPTPSSPPQTIGVSEAGDGSSVSLCQGDTLEVELPANPSTGYSWQSDFPLWPVLEALGEPQFSPDSGAIGAGGRLKLRYRATQVGQTQLVLLYRRTGQPPARTFTLNISVQ